MYCTMCATALVESARYCHHCGASQPQQDPDGAKHDAFVILDMLRMERIAVVERDCLVYLEQKHPEAFSPHPNGRKDPDFFAGYATEDLVNAIPDRWADAREALRRLVHKHIGAAFVAEPVDSPSGFCAQWKK